MILSYEMVICIGASYPTCCSTKTLHHFIFQSSSTSSVIRPMLRELSCSCYKSSLRKKKSDLPICHLKTLIMTTTVAWKLKLPITLLNLDDSPWVNDFMLRVTRMNISLMNLIILREALVKHYHHCTKCRPPNWTSLNLFPPPSPNIDLESLLDGSKCSRYLSIRNGFNPKDTCILVCVQAFKATVSHFWVYLYWIMHGYQNKISKIMICNSCTTLKQ